MTKQDFVQLLVSHDWYYERSEDINAYRNGAKQRRAIITAKNTLGEDGDYLFNKYAKRETYDSTQRATKSREMPEILCLSTGRIGVFVDKTPNGFSEVFFKGASTSEYMSQSGYFMLDDV
jgi:hypothetical protein